MKDEYIIINKTTLEKRIEELEKELQYHEDWYKKARENYDRDRKFWGQADDGEMRVASDAASTTAQEMKILKQILSQSIPLIPEIEKAFKKGQNKGAYHMKRQFKTGELTFSKAEDYISKLKFDI